MNQIFSRLSSLRNVYRSDNVTEPVLTVQALIAMWLAEEADSRTSDLTRSRKRIVSQVRYRITAQGSGKFLNIWTLVRRNSLV